MGTQQKLQVTFDGLQAKNIEQLKLLNAALFPIKYKARRLHEQHNQVICRTVVVKEVCCQD